MNTMQAIKTRKSVRTYKQDAVVVFGNTDATAPHANRPATPTILFTLKGHTETDFQHKFIRESLH